MLAYASLRQRWFPWCALLVIAVISGWTYWLFTDWWAYVGTGPTAWRKFEFPLWFQILVSSVVGLSAAGCIWLLWFAIRRAVARIKT